MTACGFKLRGAYTFPFASAALETPASAPEFSAQLRRALAGEASLRLVEAQSAPHVRIRVLEVFSEKRILSLSSGGKVREFQIEQRVKFDVVDVNEKVLLPEQLITATREYSFSDAQALAKEGEERILRADMQTNLIAQILRQLQAARPKA